MTGVTIVIPTLNGGALLRRCLKSIRAQDFPADDVEVLLMDGGSTDGSRELAASLGCEVVDNPLKLAEPGVKLGLARARHEIRVVMAADNGFPTQDWLRTVVDAFESTGARGVYTHVVDAPIDSSFCRYFNHLHADPFNWFVFRRGTHPAKFPHPVLERGDHYVVRDLRAGEPPLLALAQGFAIRGALPEGENLQDDILPLWQLIEAGERFAYVDAGVLHNTLAGFRDFLRKYRHRARAALAAGDAAHKQRHDRLSRGQRARRLLFPLYALSLVPPLFDALRWTVRDRDPVWLWHAVACPALAVVMLEAVARRSR